MTFYLTPIEGEVLVALAWAAPLATPTLRQLVAPWMTDTGLRKHLAKLSAAGLIAGQLCYRQGIGGRPERVGHVWSLTEKGEPAVPEERRPLVPAKVRGSLIDHDLVVGALLAALVADLRPQLSGLAIEREVRLDPEKRRPICDAVITLRWSAEHSLGGALPWQQGRGLPEERMRAYAVEVDRKTEPLATIQAKALAYRAIREDPTWRQRFGKPPLPLWVAPDHQRLAAIHAAWKDAWPDGRWLLLTDAEIGKLRCVQWKDGTLTRVDLGLGGSLARDLAQAVAATI